MAGETMKDRDTVRRRIFVVGVLYLAGAVVQHATGDYLGRAHVRWVWAGAVGLAAIQLGLWLWARTQPVAAALLGLAAFGAVNVAALRLAPATMLTGVAFRLVIAVMHVRALAAAGRAHAANATAEP